MGPQRMAFRPPAPVNKPASQKSASQMPAERLETQQKLDLAITTKDDSLKMMKVALQAHIGIICYLRALLPNGDFETHYISNSHPPPNKSVEDLFYLTRKEAEECYQKSIENDKDETQDISGQNSKFFQWRKVRQDGSPQGKALANLIGVGATDAMNKGYLQSLVLAIFLDPNDPNNVVETYTFNFFYNDEGQPFMDLEHSAEVSDKFDHKATGITLQKRYMTVKLFYNDSAPSNYSPPGFEDAIGEEMVIGTHNVNDPPLKIPMREFQTGHHGLTATALTVVDHLPKTLYDDESIDGPEKYARLYGQKAEYEEDARQRNVIWAADLPIHDRAVYDPTAPDVYTATINPHKAVPEDASGGLKQPIGRRGDDGTIVDITPSQVGSGKQRAMRRNACKAAGSRYIPEESIQQSQTLLSRTPLRGRTASLPRAHHGQSLAEDLFIPISQSYSGNDSQAYLGKVPEEEEEDESNTQPLSSQKLARDFHEKIALQKRKSDIEIEPLPRPRKRNIDKIVEASMLQNGYELKARSNGKARSVPKTDKPAKARKTRTPRKPRSKIAKVDTEDNKASKKTKAAPAKKRDKRQQSHSQDIIECFCGLNEEIDAMIQCDGCDMWYHAICLGILDRAFAVNRQVLCIACEMKQDKHTKWNRKQIEVAVKEMGTLALTRKVLQEVKRLGSLGSDDLNALSKSLGCSVSELKRILEGLTGGLLLQIDKELYADIYPAQQASDNNSEVTEWKWLKTPPAVKAFTRFFQYGGGVEKDIFVIRKWHSSESQTQTQSQSLSQPQSSPEPTSSQPDYVADSQGEDAQGELRSDSSSGQNGFSVFNSTQNSISTQGYTPYCVPTIKSSKAINIIDCTDVWTGNNDIEEGE
uniref:HORMA domain-containing protein n=1 Tax=Kwoniella pini CBS 10737 TaxID=1296096 RepID=A0A1B9ICD0_9TREE|nr:uncharacterized protein I206_00596 [Kwoniella pini CBS 10737]OCF53295.1 hypothetical protein I206_00596 [Kwoniella pini CBS 10737]